MQVSYEMTLVAAATKASHPLIIIYGQVELRLQAYLISVLDGGGRSQWPRGLRRRSAAARLLRLWVRIPPRAWMFVCCVLSGRGL